MSADAQNPVPRHRRRSKRRNVLLIVLALVLVGLLAGVVGVVYVGNLSRSFDSKSETISKAFPSETLRPVKPTQGPAAEAPNVLVLGSDSRSASLNLAEEGNLSDQRSDTMMWVQIPADRKNIYPMSIMRDTWVELPGFGKRKSTLPWPTGACHWWCKHLRVCSTTG